MKDKIKTRNLRIGWREWLSLPDLNVPAIKAKIDTGARTSALHTYNLEAFRSGGKERVRFFVHPLQRKELPEIKCVADVVDKRFVTNSGGHREERFVISTSIAINGLSWPIEITLTDRRDMRFRMLLGREALKNLVAVYPDKSYLTGKELAGYYKRLKKR